MHKREIRGLMKHGDFILLDIICLQISFVISYWINIGYGNPYNSYRYCFQAIVLLVSQLFMVIFSSNYKNVLRRKMDDEFISVVKSMAAILIIALIIMFVIHRSGIASRLQFGVTSVLFVVLSFTVRSMHKRNIHKSNSSRIKDRKKSMVLVTSERFVNEAMYKLNANSTNQDFFVTGIIVLDSEEGGTNEEYGIPVFPLNKETITRISRNWVDEVFILQPEDMPFSTKLMDDLMSMGIPTHYTMTALNKGNYPMTDMRMLGEYRVLTSSIHFADAGQVAMKRLMDIAGGVVGCVFTGIVFIFVAPAIYLKSPGPIFFAQERVGKNGKTFKMYKFRSMYMDAEERKAELMARNKIQDGMMFKMDDDPRIIGCEKKSRNGKPKGIGNFIRNTSLDEFPQFYNVLCGTMSLVGTRPPTLDEWEKYDLGHRVRMSIKPGLTGMWQVSGRSQITDFDEVVRLDREYIENWSLALDIKILLKTVVVVLLGRGAK